MEPKKKLCDRLKNIANIYNYKLTAKDLDNLYEHCKTKGNNTNELLVNDELVKRLIDEYLNSSNVSIDNKIDTKSSNNDDLLFSEQSPCNLGDDSRYYDLEKNFKLNIPKEIYIETYNEPIREASEDISLLNFLNNDEDSDKEETVEDKLNLINDLLDKNNVLLIQGNTGCGKTTRIPRLLLKRFKNIVCTQPRRIAAISVAKKVASDMKKVLGKEVGYSVRFDNASSRKTRLKFVTDGIILREIIHDKNLNRYDCIIIDEAHERSLNIDILLGYCKMLLKTRTDLKIIIMSATISTDKFVDFFNCPCVTIKHKIFPLQNYYIKSYESINYFEETVKTVIKLHRTEPVGDILVFLTGQEEIKTAFNMISEHIKKEQCDILMIYSTMPQQDQELIFKKSDKRKIILSTNICETSITIENIVFVVDCGRVKCKRYSNSLGIDILDVVNISKAQAKQRSGRAGRTQPGTVFRIFTRHEYENMEDNPIPEIMSCNLNDCILTLKSLGIEDIGSFDMIDKPKIEFINSSLEYLYVTRAIDVSGKITELGHKISEVPLDANLSISLLASIDYGCFDEVSIIVSMLSIDQVFIDVKNTETYYKKYIQKKDSFKNKNSDFIMLLDIYLSWKRASYDNAYLKSNFLSVRNMWQAKNICTQLQKQFNIKNSSNRATILLAFCAGFYPNTAKLFNGVYRTLFNQTECYIHHSSCISKTYAKYILYFSITRTRREYLRYCNEINIEMLCKVLNRNNTPLKAVDDKSQV